MALDRLAPELLCSILTSLNSPRDLYSLIKASPAALRAFLACRRIIFSCIIRNALSPDAIHHALALLRVPEVPVDFTTESPEAATFRQQVKEYLSQYFQANSWDFPTELPSIIELIRLISRMSQFIDGYFDFAMTKMGASEDTSYTRPLSPTETVRLQRAFLRFEIYCRINPISRRCGNMLRSDIQFYFFIKKIEPWEVEEIACIHEYFATVIGLYILEVEDSLVDAVLGSPHLRARNFEKEEFRCSERGIYKRVRYERSEKDVQNFDSLGLTELAWFSTGATASRRRAVTSIVSLGWGTLHDFIFSGFKRRWDMIQGRSYPLRHPLRDALQVAWFQRMPDAVLPLPEGEFTDSSSRPSKGWLDFNNSHDLLFIEKAFDRPMQLLLRVCGYMFWDSSRILHLSVRTVLKSLEDNHDIVTRVCGPPFTESAEERLKGYELPKAELLKLWGKLGFESSLPVT